MTETREFSERWVGSTIAPVQCIQRGAVVRTETRTYTVGRDLFGGACTAQVRGRKYITFVTERDGRKVFVDDMPDDAPTRPCEQDRHNDCRHRLGGPQEGGVLLKAGLDYFVWRCGCACHHDPARLGMLF